jgi:hypothetical protein
MVILVEIFKMLTAGLFGGAIAGIIVVFIKEKLSMKQRRKVLYAKILGLSRGIPDIVKYNELGRINFEYYRQFERLNPPKTAAQRRSLNLLKIWMAYVKETELLKSEKITYYFETLGLVWATFPQNNELDNRIRSCLSVSHYHFSMPQQFTALGGVQKWRNDQEKQIESSVIEKIAEPLNNLANYLNCQHMMKKKQIQKKHDKGGRS